MEWRKIKDGMTQDKTQCGGRKTSRKHDARYNTARRVKNAPSERAFSPSPLSRTRTLQTKPTTARKENACAAVIRTRSENCPVRFTKARANVTLPLQKPVRAAPLAVNLRTLHNLSELWNRSLWKVSLMSFSPTKACFGAPCQSAHPPRCTKPVAEKKSETFLGKVTRSLRVYLLS